MELLLVSIDVFESGEKEVEKRLVLKPASLRDSEQAKIVVCTSRGERSRDLPLDGEMSYRPLGGVIVPRNAVMFQKREE